MLIQKITNNSVLTTVEHFLFKRWQHWETSESWQPFQEKHNRNILGTACHETRPFLESARSTSHKFPRKLKAESLKSCPRISAGQSPAFWLLFPNWTNFSWTHRYGHSPEPFQEHPGTLTSKTENQLGIVPRIIPIPKSRSRPVEPAIQFTLTRKRPLTTTVCSFVCIFQNIRALKKQKVLNWVNLIFFTPWNFTFYQILRE